MLIEAASGYQCSAEQGAEPATSRVALIFYCMPNPIHRHVWYMRWRTYWRVFRKRRHHFINWMLPQLVMLITRSRYYHVAFVYCSQFNGLLSGYGCDLTFPKIKMITDYHRMITHRHADFALVYESSAPSSLARLAMLALHNTILKRRVIIKSIMRYYFGNPKDVPDCVYLSAYMLAASLETTKKQDDEIMSARSINDLLEKLVELEIMPSRYFALRGSGRLECIRYLEGNDTYGQ